MKFESLEFGNRIHNSATKFAAKSNLWLRKKSATEGLGLATEDADGPHVFIQFGHGMERLGGRFWQAYKSISAFSD